MWWLQGCCKLGASDKLLEDSDSCVASAVQSDCLEKTLSAHAEKAWKQEALSTRAAKFFKVKDDGVGGNTLTCVAKTAEDITKERKKLPESRFHSAPATITLPPAQEKEALAPLKRRQRKIQTAPVVFDARRSSIDLPKEVVAQITRKHTKDRYASNEKPLIVSDDVLQKTWKEKTTCHVYGVLTGQQQPRSERDPVFAVATEFPGPLPPVISCQKGNKGDKSPNQDNYSITYFTNGYTLACVFDGHGQWGHLVATRTVQTVPYFLAKSKSFPDSIGKALTEAFEQAHDDCVQVALQDNWNIMASGATAVAAVWKGNKIWTANCGDSRCVVSAFSGGGILHETEDNKLDVPQEVARIKKAGGNIRTHDYDDGLSVHRLYIGKENYPGLAMSRSLGDTCVKNLGVVATPEVKECEVNLAKKPFIVLSSDGIWEFLSSANVVNLIVKNNKKDGPVKAIAALHKKSMDLWEEEEVCYCDDITSLLFQL